MMNTTDRIPWILLRNTLLILALLGMAYHFYSRPEPNKEAAALCMTNAIALIMHSGRSRKKTPLGGGGPGAGAIPLACAAGLALSAACTIQGPIESRWPFEAFGGRNSVRVQACMAQPMRERLDALFLPQSGIGADYVQMVAQASNPIAAGLAGMWASSTSGRARFTDTAGSVLEIGEARKVTQSAGTPAGAVEGDFWYETSSDVLAYKDGSGVQTFPSAANVCTLNTVQTITGAKTVNANLSTTDNTYNIGGAANRFTYMGLVEARSGTSTFLVTSAVADGATAKAAIINATGGLATTGARVVEFQVGGSAVGGVHLDGSYIGPKAGTSAAALHAFPSGTGDLCSLDAAQSMSNKTLVSPVISTGWTLAANLVVYDTIHGAIAGALGAATVYLGGIGVAASSTEYPLHIVRRAGTVRNLYCFLGTAPGGADTVDFTVRKNGADQTTTCQIAAAATACNDPSNTFTVVAGDRLSVKAVSSAGTAASAACTFEEGNS